MLSPALTDHVLRTFAAVPLPERVCVLGDASGAIHEKLTLLGFESESLEGESANAMATTRDDSFGWAVTVFEVASLSQIDVQLTVLRRLIRPGGWVIVGVECDPDHPEARSCMADVEGRLEAVGYRLAQETVQHSAGYHLIVRRVVRDPRADARPYQSDV